MVKSSSEVFVDINNSFTGQNRSLTRSDRLELSNQFKFLINQHFESFITYVSKKIDEPRKGKLVDFVQIF